MPAIASGQVTALYLFDVAEETDLARLTTLTASTSIARLAPKPATPAYLQYTQPPVLVDGEALGIREIDGLRARFKFFDYGVLSLALSRPFAGSWQELIELGNGLMENEALERQAERAAREAVARLAAAFTSVRETYLSEDYLVFAVSALDEPLPADHLLERHGAELAALLRGERQPLSRQEQEEVLRHRISYLADDLVVPTWNASFVYDTEAGAQAALEIIEYANSQLLEFRYYDDLLDAELARVYTSLERPRWFDTLIGGRYARAARHMHSVFIDVTDITDRAENALKMVGDVYAARLFALVAARVGLDRWKGSVQEKLRTLAEVYRFVVERTGMSRGELLELSIVLILVFELVLFFLGIME